jgi:hypothetical protein
MVQEMGGDSVILDRVAAGESVSAIMRDFAGISRSQFYFWIKMNPERQDAWAAAKEASSHALVDAALEIVDEDVVTPADVSRNKNRVDFRKWLAGKRNRPEYGDQPMEVNVGLSLGEGFLQALKERGSMRMLRAEPVEAPQLAPGEVVDAEVAG